MTRKQFIIVTVLTLFGASLRWFHLGSQSLWFDEGYTAWAINHPPNEILRLIRADTAPPLFYLLLHAWTVLLNNHSEAALRGLSALAGTIQIPLIYLIAFRLFRRPAPAIAAAILFSLSFLQHWYSREARAYELMSLLATLAFYCLLRLQEKTGQVRFILWFFALTLILTAALYTHNMMLSLLPALFAAASIFPSSQPIRVRVFQLAALAGMVTLLYLPWLLNLSAQVHRINSGFWVARPTFDSFCSDLAGICGVRHIWAWDQFIAFRYVKVERDVPRVTILLLACGLIVIPWRLRGEPRRICLALAALALIPPLLTAAYSEIGTPVFMMKLFVFSTAPLCILIAAPHAWARPWIGRTWIVFALVLYAANNVAFIYENQNEDWRGAAQWVAQLPPSPKRLIVFVAYEGQLPFDYYHAPAPGESETGLPHGFFAVDPPNTMQRVRSDADLASLRQLIDATPFDDIVFVAAHESWSDPQGRTLDFLIGRYPTLNHAELHDVQVWQFAARPVGWAELSLSAKTTAPE